MKSLQFALSRCYAWCMVRIGSALFLCLASLPAPSGARIAEVVCDTRDRMERKLERVYNAEPMGRGLRGPDVLMELWASRATGDWALVQTYLDGRSCIVAMGEDWEALSSGPDPA
jgi:hypothetical protein